MGREQFSANYHLLFRFFKAFLFIAVLSIIVTLSLVCELSMKDLIVCCLAFFPTGWGLILVSMLKGAFSVSSDTFSICSLSFP